MYLKTHEIKNRVCKTYFPSIIKAIKPALSEVVRITGGSFETINRRKKRENVLFISWTNTQTSSHDFN